MASGMDPNRYLAPSITDHGGLRALTAMAHPLLTGAAAHSAFAQDMSFSGSSAPPPTYGGGTSGGGGPSGGGPGGGGGASAVGAAHAHGHAIHHHVTHHHHHASHHHHKAHHHAAHRHAKHHRVKRHLRHHVAFLGRLFGRHHAG